MKHESIKRIVGIAMLIAIVVILQYIAKYLVIGTVSITLVLVPIVVGAAIYGPSAGAILGGAFGLMTFIAASESSLFDGMLFAASPILCFIVCMVKAIASGFLAGWVYRLALGKQFTMKRSYFAALLASITAPIVNTGIFCLSMPLFFGDILNDTAASEGTSAIAFLFFVLVGINFVVEFAINLICTPAITTIVRAVRKSK